MDSFNNQPLFGASAVDKLIERAEAAEAALAAERARYAAPATEPVRCDCAEWKMSSDAIMSCAPVSFCPWCGKPVPVEK